MVLMLTTVPFVTIKFKLQNIFFYDFKFARAFWADLHYWLFPKFEDLHVSTNIFFLFSLFLKDETHELAINTIFILGKFFLQKNIFLKILPNFYIFLKELCHC